MSEGGKGFEFTHTEINPGPDGKPKMEKVTVSYDDEGRPSERREPMSVSVPKSEKRRQTGKPKGVQYERK